MATKSKLWLIQGIKVEGAYSVDSDRQYANNWSNLKYLNIPKKVDINLNEGDYVYKEKYDVFERIKQLTSFVMDHESQFIKNKRLDADILCFRGVLRIIMATPFQRNTPWTMYAIKFQGTIFMCMVPTKPIEEERKLEKSTSQGAPDQYGFKFEAHVLANEPYGKPPGKSEPCIESEEFCVVMSAQINNLKVLFGSEIDGIASSEVIQNIAQLDAAKLIEVKVKQPENMPYKVKNFLKFKSLAWWCSAIIVGIEEIYCGVQNGGKVKEVQIYNVKELAENAERTGMWNTQECQNFLKNFLVRLENDMRDVNDPYLVFRYSWQQNQVKLDKIKGESFLPPAYISFVKNL